MNFGDPCMHRDYPEVPLLFKFVGHRGTVVCTYEVKPEKGPWDVILKRRDVVPREPTITTLRDG